MKKRIISFILILAVVASTITITSTIYASSLEEDAIYLRDHMVKRENEIVVEYENATEEIAKDIFLKAIENNDNPIHGDYLAFHTYWSWYYPDINIDGNKIIYTVNYNDTAEQEEEVSKEVHKILDELNLDGKSDYEKICIINDWIVDNIEFENVNKNNMGSSYTAFIGKLTPCRGFAIAFYRLCKEEGIEARIVYRDDKKHEWNLVKLNNKWYHVDTQASDYHGDKRTIFLVGSDNIKHELHSDFSDIDISKEDYDANSESTTETPPTTEDTTTEIPPTTTEESKLDKPSKTKIKYIYNISGGIYLCWSKVSNVKYMIYRKSSSDPIYRKVKTTTSTYWEDKNVTNGRRYTYKIYTINKYDLKNVSSSRSIVYVSPVKINKITAYSTSVNLKWNKVIGASGYQIKYSPNGEFTNYKIKTIKGNSNTSYKLTGLRRKGAYYIKVCAYRIVSGKTYYSGWGSSKYIKTKK